MCEKHTAEQQSRFDDALAEELAELEASEHSPEDGEQEAAAVTEEGEAQLPAAVLNAIQMQSRALRNVLARHDYAIFMAEADHIGYSPAGIPIDRNELYSMVDEFPDHADIDTILGQFEIFKQDPSAYTGTASPQCMSISAAAVFDAHPTYRLDPKFHLFERERLAKPPNGMRLARLGDLLTRREDRVKPHEAPDEEFLVPTLTQTGELTPREAGIGRNPPAWFGQYFSDASRWFRIRQDDLLFSQIDIWKGCVAIVPPEYDGAVVTVEFPVYEVDRIQLDPHYLRLVLRSKYFQRAIRAITTGHSNRRRTQAYDFVDLPIFLPTDSDVQERISTAVQSCAAEIATKRGEYQAILNRVDQLIIGEITPEQFLE